MRVRRSTTRSSTTSSTTAMPRLMSAKRFEAYLGEEIFLGVTVFKCVCRYDKRKYRDEDFDDRSMENNKFSSIMMEEAR